MESKYNIVGTSRFKGVVKIRWTNNAERVRTMLRDGHEDIRFVELDTMLTKADSAYFIKHLPEFAEQEHQFAIVSYLSSRKHMISDEIKEIVSAMSDELVGVE